MKYSRLAALEISFENNFLEASFFSLMELHMWNIFSILFDEGRSNSEQLSRLLAFLIKRYLIESSKIVFLRRDKKPAEIQSLKALRCTRHEKGRISYTFIQEARRSNNLKSQCVKWQKNCVLMSPEITFL